MGPTWGPPGANRTQVAPILAPWTLLPGMYFDQFLRSVTICVKKTIFLREFIQLFSSLQISNLSPECHYDWLIYLLKNRWKMIHYWNHSAVQYYADSNVIAVNMPVFSGRDSDSYTRLYLYLYGKVCGRCDAYTNWFKHKMSMWIYILSQWFIIVTSALSKFILVAPLHCIYRRQLSLHHFSHHWLSWLLIYTHATCSANRCLYWDTKYNAIGTGFCIYLRR